MLKTENSSMFVWGGVQREDGSRGSSSGGGMEMLVTLSGDSVNTGGGVATQQAVHFKQHSSLYSNSTSTKL